MRPPHDHGHAGRSNGVSYPVGSCDHSGHGADANQPDVLAEHEPNQLNVCHRLRIAVDQQDFVFRRRERLQQKHPEMRHEVPGHTVVWAVEQNRHGSPHLLETTPENTSILIFP